MPIPGLSKSSSCARSAPITTAPRPQRRPSIDTRVARAAGEQILSISQAPLSEDVRALLSPRHECNVCSNINVFDGGRAARERRACSLPWPLSLL